MGNQVARLAENPLFLAIYYGCEQSGTNQIDDFETLARTSLYPCQRQLSTWDVNLQGRTEMQKRSTEMKVFANAAMMVGAVALMGWLMLAQSAYQQSWTQDTVAQTTAANQTDLAASLNRAMLAMK
jgi:hypothetical protein